MRIGFAGTPDFSVVPLRALIAWAQEQPDAQVCAVWTQPDRPAGRGRKLTASPVKQLALEHDMPVFQPSTLRNDDAVQDMVAQRLDVLIVVAYGLLLPQAVLDAPRLGCLNVHASLLPRWRGAAPIQRAIVAGDAHSGVAIMQMDKGLDTGPVWRQQAIEISADETGSSLHDKLAVLGAQQLVAALPQILAGGHAPTPQDDTFATYAHKLSKAQARIDWSQDAAVLHDLVRGFNSWPVADTLYEGKQLRIWETSLPDITVSADAGTIVATQDGLDVACGRGVLRITKLQPAGSRAMSAQAFLNAHECLGKRLGP